MCSVDELRKLLTDKEAYNAFFNSLDQVKIQNNVSIEATLYLLFVRLFHALFRLFIQKFLYDS